jgi:hypothetical protein
MTQTRAEQKWLDELVLELRLLNVDGARIGDVAATVREHLADSGESPNEAFGDPAEYARSLDVARPEPAGLAAVVMVNLLGLFGFMALIFAAPPASAGRSFEVTGFHVVLAAVYLLALPLIAFNLRTVVRLKTWQAGAAGVGALALLVAAALLFGDAHVASLPALPVAITGGALTLGTALWGQLSGHQDPDPLVDPLAAGEPEAKHTTWTGVLTTFLCIWSLVIAAIVMVPFAIWLQRATG